MNTPASPQQEGAMTEWLLRSFALLAYGIGVSRLAHAWWMDLSRWTLLLLLLTEGYSLLMVLVARRASTRDMSPMVVAVTSYAMFYFVLIDPAGTTRLIPEMAGVSLQLLGTAWQFAAKVSLGRSFGLLPAQRGIVVSGPYRCVRHPIYLGYLIGHVGFLLVNFSLFNAAVLVALYGAQTIRIRREEAVLAASDAYRDYQGRVRWKLVPFVY
ncbi:isoprenylcysteine carboxylmethyltransferase family protein [Piscinibacter sp. XHJ-5]|uniref:methyltransferase family protein n=1 Tax=Piscinibacter sp. XHJ-5 TaxID=3037797 RepID=UPI002452CE80|nr:isoprenylcysteine carboxylmethyltransferase family protein [Piscinibacter sp. XHJ-5]